MSPTGAQAYTRGGVTEEFPFLFTNLSPSYDRF